MRKLMIAILTSAILGAAVVWCAGSSVEALFRPASPATPAHASLFDDGPIAGQMF
jgi:hypothetical protein